MTQFDGMSPSAMKAWGVLAQAYPDLTAISTYRSPEHNANVGGAKNSQHIHGNAFDIDTSGWSQAEREAFVGAAMQSGFSGFGNYPNSMHIDVGPSRVWGPNHSASTAPEWLSAAVVAGNAAGTPSNPPEGVLWPQQEQTWQDAAASAGGLLAEAYAPQQTPSMTPMQAAPIERSARANPYLEFLKTLG